ncbi:uncharacterized protein LOC123537012 [Mercenaria mercenaria]|uniref:uncharacterized protein LOC123537012 n=1 Tax=Mercenaria mercenaria TaxID=6596 RepID=UPI00234EF28C|nr:uncharacterized protein LOC123537012 [Mercenaria mercenaria]
MPSKLSGLIPVSKTEKKTSIKFQLRETKLTYHAHIYGEVGGHRKAFDDNIEIKVTELHQLHISAAIPTEGDFGLSIHQVTRSSQQERNICNYLLSTFAYKMVKADVKNAKKKLDDCISENVEPRQWKKQIGDTENCLDKCLKLKIPSNDEDIMAAKTVLEFLRCKDKLRDCKLRRHLGVTRKTLDLVSGYRNKNALTKEIETVRKLEEELTALRGFARQVPELEEAHRDVLALHHPPVEVEDVFKSLLVLLGESDVADLEWASVQSCLKVQTEKESVLNKMKTIQKEEINKQKKQRVMKILGKYDGNHNHIREVSSDAYMCGY